MTLFIHSLPVKLRNLTPHFDCLPERPSRAEIETTTCHGYNMSATFKVFFNTLNTPHKRASNHHIHPDSSHFTAKAFKYSNIDWTQVWIIIFKEKICRILQENRKWMFKLNTPFYFNSFCFISVWIMILFESHSNRRKWRTVKMCN